MADNFYTYIQSKYNLSPENVRAVMSAMQSEKIPEHKIEFYIQRALQLKMPQFNSALRSAILESQSTGMRLGRPIHPGDRHDTRVIENKFGDRIPVMERVVQPDGTIKLVPSTRPGRITILPKKEREKYKTQYPESGEVNAERTRIIQNRQVITPTRYIPTYKKVGIDEVRSARPNPKLAPRFYYYNVDGTFDIEGHEKRPVEDPQFRGKWEDIPYAKSQVTHIVGEQFKHTILDRSVEYIRNYSHNPSANGDQLNDLIDEESQKLGMDRNKYIDYLLNGPDKSSGIKRMNIEFYIGNDYFFNQQLEMPYTNDIIFNQTKARKVLSYIQSELKKLEKQYTDEKVRQNIHRDGHKKETIEEQRERMAKEYGVDKEFRKKHSKSKPKPKRKVSSAKKKIKPTIKKCTCKSVKSRISKIKKKLTPRKIIRRTRK